METLHQDEIKRITDEELKFRYLLGGRLACSIFWGCDIRCSCKPVPDDEDFLKIKEFILKHNISYSTFMKLLLTDLRGQIVTYDGQYGELISELNSVISCYEFKRSDVGKIKENDFKEKELLEVIRKSVEIEDSELNKFLKLYNITTLDFMVLAKTSLNYQYYVIKSLGTKDLMADLVKIIRDNNLYESIECVKMYRDKFDERITNNNSTNNKKLIKAKNIFKKY